MGTFLRILLAALISCTGLLTIHAQGSTLDNFLIVTDSEHRQIYRMDLSTFNYTEILHDNHSFPIAVGYDHIEQELYWSDLAAEIKKSNLDGSNSKIFLRLPSNASAEGLAVDPISRNLYITDTGTDTITVCRLDGSAYKHIITSGIDDPRGIAVHPGIGYMFWTDWSSTNPRIEKSKMDGSGRLTIATSNLGWPNGIAIDYSANLLYWVDASINTIEKADFNGRNRMTIFTEVGHLFGLALHQDFIYYTDWMQSNILRILKTGGGRERVGPPVFGRLNGLLTYASGEGIEALNATNGCTIDRGNCSHICVPMPYNTITCLCPANMTLDVNGKTCQSECGNSVADIVMLVDTSGSIDTTEWNQQIQFIRTMVNRFTIGPNEIQIGIVTFATTVQNEFYLNRYTGRQGVLTGISAIVRRTGGTRTSLGLRYVRTTAFNATNGDRSNAPNILIVITDGQSSSVSAEADLLKQTGVKIISIGVGNGSVISQLEAMASSQRHVFQVTDFTALSTIMGEVHTIACEVDGGWSPWDSWSDCSQSCGNGTQYRQRTCTSPVPSANGLPCHGSPREERTCFTPCPTTTAMQCGNSVADIVLLVDSSGSIDTTEWNQTIQFIRTIVNGFTIGPNDIQIGIVTFASRARNEFYLNRYIGRQGVLAGISAIVRRSGGTQTWLGLKYVRTTAFNATNGDRPNAPNILIVLTDGQSSTSVSAEADLLKQAGVKIISIGVGNGRDISQLEAMASSQRHVFEVTDFSALSTIMGEVHTIACEVDGGWSPWDSWSDCNQSCGNSSQYRQRTCTSPPPSVNGLPCHGQPREERICFTPCPTTSTTQCAGTVADVVFLVDTSGSINDNEWAHQIQFISRIVNGFTISPNDIQVGIVTFATAPRNEFNLNGYREKDGVLAGINGIPKRSGTTHTSTGLEFVRTNSFNVTNGDRLNAPNILIVITDGQATRSFEPATEATLLKQAGVRIITIGVGSEINRYELENMASSQNRAFEVTDFTALAETANQVLTIICGVSPAP